MQFIKSNNILLSTARNCSRKFNGFQILEGFKGSLHRKSAKIWFWSEISPQQCETEPRILLTTIGKLYIAFLTVTNSIMSVYPFFENWCLIYPRIQIFQLRTMSDAYSCPIEHMKFLANNFLFGSENSTKKFEGFKMRRALNGNCDNASCKHSALQSHCTRTVPGIPGITIDHYWGVTLLHFQRKNSTLSVYSLAENWGKI